MQLCHKSSLLPNPSEYALEKNFFSTHCLSYKAQLEPKTPSRSRCGKNAPSLKDRKCRESLSQIKPLPQCTILFHRGSYIFLPVCGNALLAKKKCTLKIILNVKFGPNSSTLKFYFNVRNFSKVRCYNRGLRQWHSTG